MRLLCKICGKPFYRENRRGRIPKRCPDCRLKQDKQYWDWRKAAEQEV